MNTTLEHCVANEGRVKDGAEEGSHDQVFYAYYFWLCKHR